MLKYIAIYRPVRVSRDFTNHNICSCFAMWLTRSYYLYIYYVRRQHSVIRHTLKSKDRDKNTNADKSGQKMLCWPELVTRESEWVKACIYIFYSWMRQRPIRQQQKMSQSRGDNYRSHSHVHFRIGIPPFRIFNTYYIFACKYIIICVKYSDGRTPMRKCTWLLLLLLPRNCDSLWCYQTHELCSSVLTRCV